MSGLSPLSLFPAVQNLLGKTRNRRIVAQRVRREVPRMGEHRGGPHITAFVHFVLFVVRNVGQAVGSNLFGEILP